LRILTIWCQAPAGAKPSSFTAEAAAAGRAFGTVSTRPRPIFVYHFPSIAATPKRKSWSSVQHDSSTLRPAHAHEEKLNSSWKQGYLKIVFHSLHVIYHRTDVLSHEAGFAAQAILNS
jgi:hypothetical protein